MEKKAYVSYEYLDVKVRQAQLYGYIAGYENFGWELLDQRELTGEPGKVLLRLRRDSKIVNKTELIRLQRHFEDCMNQIDKLTKSIHSSAVAIALAIGLVGTAFMTGSIFAVVGNPPNYWLMTLLAIPGFAGWILPLLVYRNVMAKKTLEINPLIEAKNNEVDQVCLKGHKLME